MVAVYDPKNKTYADGWKEGFNSAVNYKSGHLEKFVIAGYSLNKLLDIIELYEVQNMKKKMTRQEAIDKVQEHLTANGFAKCFSDRLFVITLEALGLIEFEEEKKDDPCIKIRQYNPHIDDFKYHIVYKKDLIQDLETAGYKVTKNG